MGCADAEADADADELGLVTELLISLCLTGLRAVAPAQIVAITVRTAAKIIVGRVGSIPFSPPFPEAEEREGSSWP